MNSTLPCTYSGVLAELRKRLREPAPGRVQILAGPRQVGKTTLLLALAEEHGPNAIYAAADAPEASLPGWWDLLWQRVTDIARNTTAILLLDEIQYFSGWTQGLKAKVDQVQRQGLRVHVVATGSSALLVGQGAKETMAGRFERLVLYHWPAAELAAAFGLTIDEAVSCAVTLGTYPGAVPLRGEPPRWRSYVLDGIIEPAIGRDILMLQTVRRPALLRQVFALCAGHPAEILSLQKLTGMLMERGALETVAHYLHVLEQGFLVAPLQKFSEKALRRRGSPPKLVVLSQAMLSALHPGAAPGPGSEPERWGRWVENACLAHAWNSGQAVMYWREEPLEVDAVIQGSWGKWAVEVKTGRYTVRQLAGLTEFCRRFPDFRPLVLCDAAMVGVARDAGLRAMPWPEFLAGKLTDRSFDFRGFLGGTTFIVECY